MHSRRTRTYDYTVKTVFLYGVFYKLLSVFGTHVLIIGGINYAGLGFYKRGKFFHVYGGGYVTAAPTYKYSDFLHIVSLFYFLLSVSLPTFAVKYPSFPRTVARLKFSVIASDSVAIPLKKYAVYTLHFIPRDCRGRFYPIQR